MVGSVSGGARPLLCLGPTSGVFQDKPDVGPLFPARLSLQETVQARMAVKRLVRLFLWGRI